MAITNASNIKDNRRLRFTADDDLALLREVVAHNPLEDTEKWEKVQKNILEVTGKNFSVRTLKDHIFLILEIWKQKDSESQKKSGIEEVYSERDHLLQELSDICNRTHTTLKSNKRKRTLSKEKQIVELGKTAREQCALSCLPPETNNNLPSTSKQTLFDHSYYSQETLQSDFPSLEVIQNIEVLDTNIDIPWNTPLIEEKETKKENQNPQLSKETIDKLEPKKRILGPVKSRHNKSSNVRRNALEYLQNKEEKSNILRKRELDLEEQRLQLEQRKLELEELRQNNIENITKEQLEMEKQRFRHEIMERNKIYKVIEQQQKFIDSLLNKKI